MSRPRKNLIGSRFEKLKVIDGADDYISPQGLRFAQWVCECECGNIITVRGDSLRNKHTKSCGCEKVENNIKREKHGCNKRSHRMRLYSIWANMVQRCTNSNHPNYLDYGGRGITICDEWYDYNNFQKWALSNGYDETLTLDRKDTNQGYSPSNCRWISIKEQQNNKRSNHLLIYDGKSMDIAEWSFLTGIPYSTLRSRVNILGWSAEKALTTPVRKQNKCR